MLDYNHKAGIAERINDLIDAALVAERAAIPPRDYLGGSRLGHPCERALQFEFPGAPKDEGADFGGRTLRIFAIGHALEELAIGWLRGAGIEIYTRKGDRPDGGQVSSASRSPAAASAVTSTASSPLRRRRSGSVFRRSGNARR